MIPSQNCYDFIAKEEGEVLHPYKDSAGIPTIGIGSITYKDGTKVQMTDQPITHEQAMDLLEWEVGQKTAAVATYTVGVPLNQNQFDALVSFAYNVGTGALQSSTLLKKLKVNADDPSIRDEFLKWNKITVNGKKVASAGLTARRKREADLYFS